MTRNTLTTFDDLQPGDRFFFAGERLKICHQITHRGYYNQVLEDGRKTMLHDRQARPETQVIFLRNALQ